MRSGVAPSACSASAVAILGWAMPVAWKNAPVWSGQAGLLIAAMLLLLAAWFHFRPKRLGVVAISLDDAIRYIATKSSFGISRRDDDPRFSVWVADSLVGALVSGDLRSRGRHFHVLHGGIRNPPLYPKIDIPSAFWVNRVINSWWALNDRNQRMGGALVSSGIPPLKDSYEGMHDIELDRDRVEQIWPREKTRWLKQKTQGLTAS